MNRAPRYDRPPESCEIIDFDEALLNALPSGALADLMMEAQLLADAFAPGASSFTLRRLAEGLAHGARDADIGRAHAHRLSAALRRLARQSD